MAEYHLSLKIGAKGKAAPHFHYITATEQYAAKRGVVHVEHGNMPLWASADPSLFWRASDEYERANGTAYRELEVSLPRELPLAEQIELSKQLAEEACGSNHAFSFAIHHTKASDGGLNPHVHLQFSERIDDGFEREPQHYFKRANKKEPEKGGCVKDRSWQATKRGNQKVAESSDRLLDIRLQWEVICNQALNDFGVDASVDCRSYADQGIELTPQPKVGAKSWHRFLRTGEKNERYARWEEIMQANRPILCDAALLELNKLMEQKSQLIESRKVIRDQIAELKNCEPVTRTRDQIITDMLPNTRSGKNALSAINESQRGLKAAQKRYDSYCMVMDTPLSLSNIRSKLMCFWNHTTRAGEKALLVEAKQTFVNARQEATSLLKRAKQSPAMHTKVKPLMDAEQKKRQGWQRDIDHYRQRLSEVDATLHATSTSLKLLYSKYPEISQKKRHSPAIYSQTIEIALPQFEATTPSFPRPRP